MLKAAYRLQLICVLALFCGPGLRAKDLAAYRIGDIATEDLITPIAMDVIDPEATAALKESAALKVSAIYINRSFETNKITGELMTAFAAARSNFVASVQDTFHRATLGDKMIASPDFGYLVTAFSIKSRNFPVPEALAADWARGNAGLGEQSRLLTILLQVMQHPIRPDELPADFVAGETVRFVPVDNPNGKLTRDDVEARGQLLESSNIVTISRARMIFRDQFPADDEQPLARVLAALIEPNCIPSVKLTQLVRDRAVGQLVVAEHYAAGQLIARRGDVIDARLKAVLDQLNEKLIAGPPPPQLITESAPASGEHQPASPPENFSQPPNAILKIPDQVSVPKHQILKINGRETWLVIGTMAVGLLTLLVVKRLNARRQSAGLVPIREVDLPVQTPVVLRPEMAPELIQVVKDTLVQELAAHRRELMQVQERAAAEIAELVRRLDEVQAPLQERLRAYELQIQRLEKALAERTEENRELLKLKIELTRDQLESERRRFPPEYN